MTGQCCVVGPCCSAEHRARQHNFLPLSALATYLGGVRMLALQLLQVQLIDLSEYQKLPIQELHLLLHRLTIGELSRCK